MFFDHRLSRIVAISLTLFIVLCSVGCKKNTNTDGSDELSTEVEYEYIYESDYSGDDMVTSNNSNTNGGSKAKKSQKNSSVGGGKNTTATASGGGSTASSLKTDETVTQKNYTLSGDVSGYYTSNNKNALLNNIPSSLLKVQKNKSTSDSDGIVVTINPNEVYQTIDGFGGAFTDATCKNLSIMSSENRNYIMSSLFDKENGIGLNYLRQPCGVTDYAVDWHTYDDMPEGQTDMELKNFTIARDYDYIIPALKQALSVNSDIKVISSVWSPPLWMKTKYSWITTPEDGNLSSPATPQNTAMLKPECYDVFAQYMIKYIKAYAGEGIHIASIVPQNEPTGRHGIPATYYTAEIMSDFINNHAAPAFKNAGLDTEIWSWDFNFFDDAKYFTLGAINSIQGIAMHYPDDGYLDLITNLHNNYDLPVYLTETGSNLTFSELACNSVSAIKWIRAGASAIIRWNLVLDEYGGPSDSRNPHLHSEANETGYGVIGYNTKTKVITKSADYYTLGHFSKFVNRGAKMIGTNESDDEFVGYVAFLNPDNSIAVVMSNQGMKNKKLSLIINDKKIQYTLPAETVATLIFNTVEK